MEHLIETFAIYGSPLALTLCGIALYFMWQDYKADKEKAEKKALKKARKKEKKRLKNLASA